MAFDLKNGVHRGVQRKARKMLIYGPPKMGKSTIVGATKNAIMIPTEDRVAHIACDKTPVVSHYSEIIEIFDSLINENHGYKRVIIDTLDWTEPLIWNYLCEKNNWKSITDDHNKETAFSKGLKYHAPAAWKKFLFNCDVLRDHGMDVILVSHAQVVKVNPPDGDEYDKHVMKIDKNSLAVVEEWSDIIAFYDREVFVQKTGNSLKTTGKAITTNNRILHLSGKSAAMISGNSFGLEDLTVDLNACTEIMEYILTGPYDAAQAQTAATKSNKKGDK